MTKSQSDKFVSSVQNFAFSQESSVVILRSVGYGLLILALFDIIETFIPPNFMNAAWEFQTIGALVERVPVPLISLALIFYGEMNLRRRWEFPLLKFLSWLTVIFGVLYFLMIPLGVVNSVRLQKQNIDQADSAVVEQIARAEQIEKQLKGATPQQIQAFLKSQGRGSNDETVTEVKTKLLSNISQAKQNIKAQAQAQQSYRGLNLTKKAVKWNLGALIAGVLFFCIWKGTQWARIS
ncbi:MAG: HpsJ family protein [Cyanobacteria bacterium P01_A01_bin.84]